MKNQVRGAAVLALLFVLLLGPNRGCDSGPSALETNDTSGAVVWLSADRRVFLDETPMVTLRIRSTLPVLKASAAAGWRALQVDVLTSSGVPLERRDVGCGPRRPMAPSDFVLPGPGQTIAYDTCPTARPKTAGNYRLRVLFKPFQDQKVVFTQEFPVTYVEIRDQAIADRVVVRLPQNPHWPPSDARKVELLNVRDEGRNLLVFRSENFVRRVRELDEDSRLAATPKYFEIADHFQEIWVYYNRQGKHYRARLHAVVGRIREDSEVGKESLADAMLEELLHMR